MSTSGWQRILLVGDGDFSFARALTVVLGSGANLVATAFDSRDLLLEASHLLSPPATCLHIGRESHSLVPITEVQRRRCRDFGGGEARGQGAVRHRRHQSVPMLARGSVHILLIAPHVHVPLPPLLTAMVGECRQEAG